MNLQEAAIFLGRHERAVERYKKQGRLSARKVKVTRKDGKKGEVLDFDERELQTLKDELDSPSQVISPQVARMEPQDEPGALIPSAGLQILAELLQRQERGQTALVAVSDPWPVWMPRAKALELAGLPATWFDAGVRKGELRPTGAGRARRFHRDDVRAFAELVREPAYLARLLEKVSNNATPKRATKRARPPAR
jgi:hypothetical protein